MCACYMYSFTWQSSFRPEPLSCSKHLPSVNLHGVVWSYSIHVALHTIVEIEEPPWTFFLFFFCCLSLFQLPPTLDTPYELQLLFCMFPTVNFRVYEATKSLLQCFNWSDLVNNSHTSLLLSTSNHMNILPGLLIHSVWIPSLSPAFSFSFSNCTTYSITCPYQTIRTSTWKLSPLSSTL